MSEFKCLQTDPQEQEVETTAGKQRCCYTNTHSATRADVQQ